MNDRRSHWSATLQRAWLHRGLLACVLWPVSLVYGALLWVRRWLYRLKFKTIEKLPVPVVVVGNVVVGGTGKTPTVTALIQHLQARGWRPGVISRGHGRSGTDGLSVQVDTPAALCGDEPLLIVRRTGVPLFVGRDRVAVARALLKAHPEVDVLVSDDGMQHWRLGRDVTLVLFDQRGVGNGWLLPAGLLREPWPIRQPQGALWVLRRDGTQSTWRDAPFPEFHVKRQLAGTAYDKEGRQCALNDLAHTHPPQRWAAIAGIAQPEAFFAMLREQGVELTLTVALPDHAQTDAFLQALDPGFGWLCTEKDAVKLFPALLGQDHPPIWAVPLNQSLDPQLLQRLDLELEKLSSTHGCQTP